MCQRSPAPRSHQTGGEDVSLSCRPREGAGKRRLDRELELERSGALDAGIDAAAAWRGRRAQVLRSPPAGAGEPPDTTRPSVHELRRQVVLPFGPGAGKSARMRTRVLSFGLEYGGPVDADRDARRALHRKPRSSCRTSGTCRGSSQRRRATCWRGRTRKASRPMSHCTVHGRPRRQRVLGERAPMLASFVAASEVLGTGGIAARAANVTSVAPYSRARLCRAGCRLMAMMRSAPSALAERTASRPTEPRRLRSANGLCCWQDVW